MRGRGGRSPEWGRMGDGGPSIELSTIKWIMNLSPRPPLALFALGAFETYPVGAIEEGPKSFCSARLRDLASGNVLIH